MLYDPRLRNTKPTDGKYDFDYNSPCVWVVYPPGCGGDLWGAIIGQHYPRTGNHFLGIDQTGRVILDTIDHKWLNVKMNKRETVELDQEYLNCINQGYRSHNFPHSMSGQCIIVNHFWQSTLINQIIDRFPNAKIIRIMPRTDFEIKLIEWLSQWKNFGTLMDFDSMVDDKIQRYAVKDLDFKHPRLLDLQYGSMWSESGFEQTYDQVTQHLGLPYKLVRYDLIKFWFECQHGTIKPHFAKLFDNY